MSVIALVNTSGNVGKSTLAKHCLAPTAKRQPAQIIAVETINMDDNGDQPRFQGQEVRNIFREALGAAIDSDVILDIGSSNLAQFLIAARNFGGVVVSEVALWVIPFLNDRKVKEDTKFTLQLLRDIKVATKKMVVVANRYEESAASRKDLEDAIADFDVAYIEYPVDENEIYSRVRKTETIKEIAEDATDYAKVRASLGRGPEWFAAYERQMDIELAKTADANLREVGREIWKRAK